MAAQAGLCLAWSETPEDTFCHVVVHIVFNDQCDIQYHSNIYLPILHNMILFKRRYSSRVIPMLVNFLHIFRVSESNSMAHLYLSASPTVKFKSSASLSVPLYGVERKIRLRRLISSHECWRRFIWSERERLENPAMIEKIIKTYSYTFVLELHLNHLFILGI